MFFSILFPSFASSFSLTFEVVCRGTEGRGGHVDLVGLDAAERKGHCSSFRVATKGRHTIFFLRVGFVLALIRSFVLGSDGMDRDRTGGGSGVAFEVYNNRPFEWMCGLLWVVLSGMYLVLGSSFCLSCREVFPVGLYMDMSCRFGWTDGTEHDRQALRWCWDILSKDANRYLSTTVHAATIKYGNCSMPVGSEMLCLDSLAISV